MHRDASLKHVSHATIVDNSDRVYNTTLMMLLASLISDKYGISLSRYVHTETLDIKSSLEGHFGSSGRRNNIWMKAWNDVSTPIECFYPLTGTGGIKNTTLQPIASDSYRPSLQLWTIFQENHSSHMHFSTYFMSLDIQFNHRISLFSIYFTGSYLWDQCIQKSTLMPLYKRIDLLIKSHSQIFFSLLVLNPATRFQYHWSKNWNSLMTLMSVG